jgi:hypothetical protein
MAKPTIKFPAKELGSILHFGKELDYFSMRNELTVDMADQSFFSPFALLFVASKLKSFCERNAHLKLDFANFREHDYPKHMGFYQLCGFDYGRKVGDQHGENYIPISELTRDTLYARPEDRFAELPDLVQRHADELALLIARDQNKNRDLYDALSYAIREVMRNVFEHSEANSLYYCAQYWPKSNRVEFALADFGVGIRRGLGENPNFRFNNDKDAIEYSLLPSVSGKTHLPRRSTVWFNSGYGLYMTSRLARHGGNFVLASGMKAIHLTNKNKGNYDTSFSGTALRFNFDVDEIGSVTARLDQFRNEGAKIAKSIAGSGNRPPSAMSLLLRRDYQAEPRKRR